MHLITMIMLTYTMSENVKRCETQIVEMKLLDKMYEYYIYTSAELEIVE